MKVYVVKMNRYPGFKKHSYILGVWSTREKAIEAGIKERSHRKGKYRATIFSFVTDANEFDGEELPEWQK